MFKNIVIFLNIALFLYILLIPLSIILPFLYFFQNSTVFGLLLIFTPLLTIIFLFKQKGNLKDLFKSIPFYLHFFLLVYMVYAFSNIFQNNYQIIWEFNFYYVAILGLIAPLFTYLLIFNKHGKEIMEQFWQDSKWLKKGMIIGLIIGLIHISFYHLLSSASPPNNFISLYVAVDKYLIIPIKPVFTFFINQLDIFLHKQSVILFLQERNIVPNFMVLFYSIILISWFIAGIFYGFIFRLIFKLFKKLKPT